MMYMRLTLDFIVRRHARCVECAPSDVDVDEFTRSIREMLTHSFRADTGGLEIYEGIVSAIERAFTGNSDRDHGCVVCNDVVLLKADLSSSLESTWRWMGELKEGLEAAWVPYSWKAAWGSQFDLFIDNTLWSAARRDAFLTWDTLSRGGGGRAAYDGVHEHGMLNFTVAADVETPAGVPSTVRDLTSYMTPACMFCNKRTLFTMMVNLHPDGGVVANHTLCMRCYMSKRFDSRQASVGAPASVGFQCPWHGCTVGRARGPLSLRF
jgi:hypothetical protein